MTDLSGRVALITGASSGIGAATARLLAARGCGIAINFSKSRTAAEAVAAECRKSGVDTLLVQGNVASDTDCRRIVDEAVSHFGHLDYLVNNAGTTKFVAHRDLAGLSAQDFLDIYAVNTIGPFQMVRAAEPYLRATKGAIVNVSSIAGVVAVGSSLAYVASKAALNGLTLGLARVLAPEVRINSVCPGFVFDPGRFCRRHRRRLHPVRAAGDETLRLPLTVASPRAKRNRRRCSPDLLWGYPGDLNH